MNFNENKNKVILIVFGSLICFNIIAWLWIWGLNKPKFLEITFFDIGQGDSIFIETPDNKQILIDGGPSSAVLLEKLAKEMPFYDRTIDLLILTHSEHDHYKGLFEVFERYEIKNILWTGVIRDTDEYKEWMRLIKQEGANIKIAQAGQKIILYKEPLIFIDILYPFENLEGKEVKGANHTSIVAQLVFNSIEFLFTGDISKKIEIELIKHYNDLDSEVLKVGHHGSKTSTALEFLQEVLPEIAVIQCGKDNRYGHPHLEVLANLEQFDIQVLRTDENGDIKIVSDGDNFKIVKIIK